MWQPPKPGWRTKGRRVIAGHFAREWKSLRLGSPAPGLAASLHLLELLAARLRMSVLVALVSASTHSFLVPTPVLAYHRGTAAGRQLVGATDKHRPWLLRRHSTFTTLPQIRMQLFPTDDLPEAFPRPVRSTQMADLLRSLVAQPGDTRRLLQDATSMLLVPFYSNAIQEEGSIFRSDMLMAEKMEVYSDTLERRIAAAKQAETRVALRTMRDHVLQEVAQLRD